MILNRSIENCCICHIDMELLHNSSDYFSYMGLANEKLWLYWCPNCGQLAKVTSFTPANPKFESGEIVEWVVPKNI